MLEKILFATDLSAYAGAVLDCLAGLRSAGVQQVVLLHVVDQALSYVEGAAGFDVIGQLKLDAQRALEREKGRLEGQGFRVSARIEVGVPAQEIVRVAEEEDVSLIVVGAYGRTLLQEMLLGSVAEGVLRLARRPVMVERPRVLAGLGRVECQRRGARTFARVLFPTDFSPFAELSLRFVVGLRDAGVEEVIVLHVLEEPMLRGRSLREAEQLAQDARASLDEVVAKLKGEGLPARGRLERGRPIERILEVAEEEDVGSIVMGARRRGMVVRRSLRPVVIVPGRRKEPWRRYSR